MIINKDYSSLLHRGKKILNNPNYDSDWYFKPENTNAWEHVVSRMSYFGKYITPIMLACLIGLSIFVFSTNYYSPNHAYTASWYSLNDPSDPWLHVTTASGQHFNENALTAASWKYPLGSVIKVTNLINKKSVVVLINDRGPAKYLYRKGRVIDLTKEAFSKIADLKDGVIKISLEVA